MVDICVRVQTRRLSRPAELLQSRRPSVMRQSDVQAATNAAIQDFALNGYARVNAKASFINVVVPSFPLALTCTMCTFAKVNCSKPDTWLGQRSTYRMAGQICCSGYSYPADVAEGSVVSILMLVLSELRFHTRDGSANEVPKSCVSIPTRNVDLSKALLKQALVF